ncbi:DinB family protein [Flavobacterium okayamense]|uniref:DNA damage-inducible protein DinB n=1 Tax=Flavobacterium okayamense TaxID=2830782 RepID=A0ABM7S873_9FLAO|nr:DinB family protein [Flavobacterium okayamense]BCY29146.1 DNA damage-inducible protein DinB [Flavobacterium okayamense]
MILNENEFAPYYELYIKKAQQYNSILEGLIDNEKEIISFFNNFPTEKLEFRYAEGKWTPKDILLHLIDAERIFAYRGLCIARNDKTEFPGFEENDYVEEANANLREIDDLIEEFKSVRKSTFLMYKSFDDVQLKRVGIASDCSVSVRALAYMTLGHYLHHMQIIKERYL